MGNVRVCRIVGFMVIIILNSWLLLDCHAEFENKRMAYYKEIDTKGVEIGKNYRIVLNKDVYSQVQESLSDLRLALNEEREVPYEIFIFKEKKKTSAFESKIIENYINEDKANVMIIELNKPGQKNNQIILDIDGCNFGRRVMIEGSDDGQNWQLLTKDKYIYDFTFGRGNLPQAGELKWHRVVDNRYMADFSFDASSRNTAVTYKENQFPYLKITIFGAKDEESLSINKVKVFSYEQVPSEETEYKCSIQSNFINKEQKSSEITLDLGVKNIPISALKIESDSKNYYRAVHIQASNDLKNWNDVDQGYIFDYNIENFKEANKKINFSETRHRYLKLIILNQDNSPVQIDSVIAVGLNRSLVFPYEEKGNLKIYYGNPNLKKPRYDYALFVQKIDAQTLKILPVGQQIQNPAYVFEKAKKPWSEERPYLLWITIMGIILILLFLVISMLKKIT